eukprot:9498944-Pyramimonas_sp.AAC.1
MGRGRHANFATGAFGGAPYGGTKRVRGAPKCGGAAMRLATAQPEAHACATRGFSQPPRGDPSPAAMPWRRTS